jgi:hypothetical protein
MNDTVDSKNLMPGMVVMHRSGSRATLLRRKDDDRGWWCVEGGGIADWVLDGGEWTLKQSIDAAHLAHQRDWSLRTFGPGPRTKGVLDHIRKELVEIEAAPSDLGEWADVVILAFDGAWRAGWEPQLIIDAVKAKQAKNEARVWPDWRTMSEDVAIEHDRAVEAAE